ncbi:MAG: helix-turn-helix transcriptional regulator [bacterium]|nr:helix-turn-helix transcriptional regulator [bacterium]
MERIRSEVQAGTRRADVAEAWDVSLSTVNAIMSGRLTGKDPTEAREEAQQVRDIRNLAAQGVTQSEIAAQFGLTQQAVSQIVRGVTHQRT